MEGIIVPINRTSSSSSSQENESKKLMIPTTEELRQLTQNKEALLQIASLRQTAQQITCEKLSTANQTLKVVHSILSKLDQDIAEYENLLKAGGLSTLNRGDTIYAVFPDTTSFYQATVVEMTKKIRGRIHLFWFISKMMEMNMGLHMQKLFQ